MEPSELPSEAVSETPSVKPSETLSDQLPREPNDAATVKREKPCGGAPEAPRFFSHVPMNDMNDMNEFIELSGLIDMNE